ncbi:MAG TPA: S49 family peptidase [Gammaproteobacteria bacterium]
MMPATLDALARGDRLAEPPAPLTAFMTRRGIVHHVGSQLAGVIDGVGVLPVFGPVLFRQRWQAIAADFGALLDDDAIKAIILDVDSPGGLLTGTQEFADLVHGARGRKPIIAFAGGWAASAAYWVASAADQVVIAETGEAGSIGVAALYVDFKRALEGAGIRTVEVISSQSPKKRVDPTTEEGRALLQRRVDDQAAVFVSRVARFRGVDETTVLERFGQGDMLVGRNAVRAGLADRIGSFESLLTELGATARSSRRAPAPASSPQPSRTTRASVDAPATDQPEEPRTARELGQADERRRIVELLDLAPKGSIGDPVVSPELQRAIAEGSAPGAFALAALQAIKGSAPADNSAPAVEPSQQPPSAEAMPPALAQAHREYEQGVSVERARVLALLAADLPAGFEAARQAAIRWGRSVNQLAAEIVATIRDRGVTLEQLRASAPPPVPHAVPPTQQPASSSWKRVAENVYRERAKPSGKGGDGN